MADIDELVKKINFPNFIRFIGPGVVLFGFLNVSDLCLLQKLNWQQNQNIDKLALLFWFIVVGVLVYSFYHGLLYNIYVAWAKDKLRHLLEYCHLIPRYSNYREILREQYSNQEMSNFDAEWAWREIRREFKVEEKLYSPSMPLWASAIHLLYFTTITGFIFTFAELIWSSNLGLKVFGMVTTILAFIGALASDICYERSETCIYEQVVQEENFEQFMIHLLSSAAFRRQEGAKAKDEQKQ